MSPVLPVLDPPDANGSTPLSSRKPIRPKRQSLGLNKYALWKYWDSFWPMPNSFVETGLLEKIWTADGTGSALGLLPIIGMHSNTVPNGELYLGLNAMADLAGLSVGGVKSGQRILEALGLANFSIKTKPNRQTVTTWTMDPGLYMPTARQGVKDPTDDNANGYLSVSARAVYGGNWAALSSMQKAVFLAAGSQVRTYDRENVEGLLWFNDVQDEELGHICQRDRVVMEFVSLVDLQAFTGASRSALGKAVNCFERSQESLLHVYGAGTGCRVFLINDDVQPLRNYSANHAQVFDGMIPEKADIKGLTKYSANRVEVFDGMTQEEMDAAGVMVAND